MVVMQRSDRSSNHFIGLTASLLLSISRGGNIQRCTHALYNDHMFSRGGSIRTTIIMPVAMSAPVAARIFCTDKLLLL